MTNPPTKPESTKPRMSLPARLFFSLLFFAPAIYFAVQGDSIVAMALAIVGIASFGGYRMGAVYIIGSLASIGAAIALAPAIGQSQEYRFTEWFGTTGLLNRFLSIGTVGLLVSFLVSLFVIILSGLFFANRRRLDTLNRWLGFSLGSVQGVVTVLLLLGGLLIIEPSERKRADTRDPLDLRGQFVSKWILKISDNIHESRLEPTIVAYNPFTRVPQLNKVEEIQKSVLVLSNPQKIDELMHHPAIDRLQQRPEIRRAVEKLNNDPQIQEILQSGKAIDRAATMTLLSHPAVLELIDQPGFMKEAYKVIKETNVIE